MTLSKMIGMLASATAMTIVNIPSAGAGTYGSGDLRQMSRTYSENEAMFNRVYAGQSFYADMPFHSASESMFFKGTYTVGFGAGITPDVDCTFTSPETIDAISTWHKGRMIQVSGNIKSSTFGTIELSSCHLGM